MKYFIIFIILIYNVAVAEDMFNSSIKISNAGMKLQSQRLKVIAENIANHNIPSNHNNNKPYTRKVIEVDQVQDNNVTIPKVINVSEYKSPYIRKYDPMHPASDENGFVLYPNVDLIQEHADSEEAQRNFEANVHALEIAKSNNTKIIELLK